MAEVMHLLLYIGGFHPELEDKSGYAEVEFFRFSKCETSTQELVETSREGVLVRVANRWIEKAKPAVGSDREFDVVHHFDKVVTTLERAVEVGDLGAIVNAVRDLRRLVWDLED